MPSSTEYVRSYFPYPSDRYPPQYIYTTARQEQPRWALGKVRGPTPTGEQSSPLHRAPGSYLVSSGERNVIFPVITHLRRRLTPSGPPRGKMDCAGVSRRHEHPQAGAHPQRNREGKHYIFSPYVVSASVRMDSIADSSGPTEDACQPPEEMAPLEHLKRI